MKRSFLLNPDVLKQIRVNPKKMIKLKNYDTSWVRNRELKKYRLDLLKSEAKEVIHKNVLKLTEAQEMLYSSGSHGILIILQGMDASGKDGAIKHVMSGINPQGCQVHSFKEPTSEELSHHFLWRYTRSTPSRGQISIFNRSHYEDVVTVRVHPEWLEKQQIESVSNTKKFWKERYQDINNLERSLTRNGMVILKFFLHISKKEQKNRLLERLRDHRKFWKFSPSDFTERAFWKDYQKYYEETISLTSTEWAPWYIIPADSKWPARALIADVISYSIRSLNLQPYRVTSAMEKKVIEFRRKMEEE